MKLRSSLALLLFLPAIAIAALSIKIALNFDSTVDTKYRDGAKPQSGCSTWTFASKGDADGSCNEVSASAVTIAASGSNDHGNIDYAYQSEATDVDMQIEAQIPSSWAGWLESGTGCGVLLTEGAGDNDYSFQVWWPNVGTARAKVWDGTASEQLGASGQFLPRYLAARYDDASTRLQGFESADGTTWFQIGANVTKSLTFPIRYGVFCTSHDPAQTTTVAITDIAFTTTPDITDAGDPDPPTGNDHLIATGTGTFDCNANSVEPGDTVTIDGTTRGALLIKNCAGTAANKITIRNDVTESGALVIARASGSQGGFILELRSVTHAVLDGTGGWSGSSGTCSGLLSWPTINTPGLECGIKLTRTGGEGPSSWLHISGTSTFITVKGLEVDGDRVNVARGIGIQLNDHSVKDSGVPYSSITDPVEWREGFRFTDNYIHNTTYECIYLGPNYNSGDFDDWKLRDIEVDHNYVLNCGRDGIKVKSTWGDPDDVKIHHNFVDNLGLSQGSLATGASDHCITLFEGGGTVYNNFCRDNSAGLNNRAGIIAYSIAVPSSFGTLAINAYNNVLVDIEGDGMAAGRQSTSDIVITPTFYNNTIIDPGGFGIGISSNIPSGTVRDNIIAGHSGSAMSLPAGVTNTNNLSGPVASQNFNNSAGDDFHLTATSPARNAGTASAPATDHDDVARPQESVDDVGAFEYVP